MKKINIISIGAGVQSSALALMAEKNFISPKPDLAIFADTQAEPQFVYDQLEYLKKNISYELKIVTAGSLTDKTLQERKRVKDGKYYMPNEIPLFGISKSGKIHGALGRQCTNDFKIQPIVKFLRNYYNIKRGEKEKIINQWLGISYDEILRMKPSRIKWINNVFPLIDKKLKRIDCLKWLKDNNFLIPKRSACYYCPFHSDSEWRDLKMNAPLDFDKAVKFDKKIREKFLKYDKKNMEVFLHRSCKPLDQIDFRNDIDKGQQVFDFSSECEGMCGI